MVGEGLVGEGLVGEGEANEQILETIETGKDARSQGGDDVVVQVAGVSKDGRQQRSIWGVWWGTRRREEGKEAWGVWRGTRRREEGKMDSEMEDAHDGELREARKDAYR